MKRKENVFIRDSSVQENHEIGPDFETLNFHSNSIKVLGRWSSTEEEAFLLLAAPKSSLLSHEMLAEKAQGCLPFVDVHTPKFLEELRFALHPDFSPGLILAFSRHSSQCSSVFGTGFTHTSSQLLLLCSDSQAGQSPFWSSLSLQLPLTEMPLAYGRHLSLLCNSYRLSPVFVFL